MSEQTTAPQTYGKLTRILHTSLCFLHKSAYVMSEPRPYEPFKGHAIRSLNESLRNIGHLNRAP
ncbi:hypothetical protein CTA1_8519 [Colletotrichum tanaceti]|uniref:Uncharacterized protein n=1 Tax=Colletotrichum tanaceti TaxID=1306861 RepID=A0A4U6XPB4_9PEZI|nr:hypothetical protein CTA1_8519 [Colletotrichum tanaceti]